MVDMASFVMGAASACAVIAAYVILARVIKEPEPKKGRTRWSVRVNRRLNDLEMALSYQMGRGFPKPDAVVLPSSPEKRVTLRAIEHQLEPGGDLDEVFSRYGRLCGREKAELRAAVLARQAKG